MSSSAIMAIIKQKEAELAKLKSTKSQVVLLNDAVNCTANKFEKAGILCVFQFFKLKSWVKKSVRKHIRFIQRLL